MVSGALPEMNFGGNLPLVKDPTAVQGANEKARRMRLLNSLGFQKNTDA